VVEFGQLIFQLLPVRLLLALQFGADVGFPFSIAHLVFDEIRQLSLNRSSLGGRLG